MLCCALPTQLFLDVVQGVLVFVRGRDLAIVLDRAFLIDAAVLVLAGPEEVLGGRTKVVYLQRVSSGAIVQEFDALGLDIVNQREPVRYLVFIVEVEVPKRNGSKQE